MIMIVMTVAIIEDDFTGTRRSLPPSHESENRLENQ